MKTRSETPLSAADVLPHCQHILSGAGPRRTMREVLNEIADSLDGNEYFDNYGEGDYLAAFEAEVAQLFGKEAAVFMPSGTLAQLIALRVWCGRRGNFSVAMHPTAHPEFAEHGGYHFLHGMHRLQFGAPEFAAERAPAAKDFETLGETPGCALLELPCRPLGGQLPPWDDLLALRDWAHARGVPLHLDGARIWSCRPFYGKSFAEIAALFDSVYVSFYKDLGGLSGAMLLGSADFIREARVWQVRHGGRLRTQGPFIAAARAGLQRTLPQIDQWVTRAQAAAEILSRFDAITINPTVPQVNFFQLYIRGDAAALTARHHALAKETGVFLFHALSPTVVPGLARTEIHCWAPAMEFDLDRLAPFVERLLAAD